MKIDRSKFLSFCLSMTPVMIIACGGGGDGTAAGGSDLSAPPSAPPAPGSGTAPSSQPATDGGAPATGGGGDVVTVNTVPLTVKTDACTADTKAPTVSIPTNKAAEAAINKTLAPLSANPCDESGETDASQQFEVTANAHGLLSIRVTGDFFFSQTPHPNGFVQTFNFDVTNGGKRLQLSDVLTASGLSKELAQCARTVTDLTGSDPGSPVDEGAQFDCTASLTADPTIEFQPNWVATKDGLEVEADVAHAEGDFVSSTVVWKDLLPDGLNPTVVVDFGKAPQ